MTSRKVARESLEDAFSAPSGPGRRGAGLANFLPPSRAPRPSAASPVSPSRTDPGAEEPCTSGRERRAEPSRDERANATPRSCSRSERAGSAEASRVACNIAGIVGSAEARRVVDREFSGRCGCSREHADLHRQCDLDCAQG